MLLASSFFSVIYIVIGIFVVLALSGLTGGERESKKRRLSHAQVNINYNDLPDPIASDVLSTYIGGARFYCSRHDRRSFVGFVRFDPDNEAPAIYRNDLKMLGHIPRERLKEYLAWSKNETFPCVGYVLQGPDNESLATEIKIIKPYNRAYVESEIKRYIGWLTLTHGYDMAPHPNSLEPLLDADTIARLKKEKTSEDRRHRHSLLSKLKK